MFRWLAKQLIRRSLRLHRARDVDALLATYTDDVHFVFPGTSSWAIDTHGKAALRSWLERFHALGLELDVHDILVDGPPWNLRACLQYTNHAVDEQGRVIYENSGVILARSRWGKIASYTVFEDTEKVSAFDVYLASRTTASRATA